MSRFKTYYFNFFLLFILIVSIATQGCDSTECCGLGCGILGGSSSCKSSAPEYLPNPKPPISLPPVPVAKPPYGIAVTSQGEWVVTDFRRNAILYVDQNTGDRTIISDASVGDGPGFDFPQSIAVTSNGDFIVTDLSLDAIFYVDQVTGDRTIISDQSTGVGPVFVELEGIAITTDGDFVVTDTGLDAVVLVDQFTGDRTIISDAIAGDGPGFKYPQYVAVTPDGDYVVTDSSLRAVVRVDQITGNRTIISDSNNGSGPGFELLLDIAVTLDGNYVVTDIVQGAVILIDQFTSDRSIVFGDNMGIVPSPSPAPEPEPVPVPDANVTAPVLLTPVDNVMVAQNNPNIGCPFHSFRGFGYRVYFDWTDSDSPNGIRGYHLYVTRINAIFPLIDIFVGESEYNDTKCNNFIIDRNLNNWIWSVQAEDNLGILSPVVEDEFRFQPCRLSNGAVCTAP
jgi:hypothetical protein